MPLVALLYGLLLPSGNDAAIALADDVAGSQPRFISLMNAKAHALALTCTHYTTVSGIVDRGNHSCAEDLALIAHLVLEQPLLARIVASRSAIVPFPIKGGKLFLYNNNPLLVVGYPGTEGSKPDSRTRPACAWWQPRGADGPGWAWCCSIRATPRLRRSSC